MLSNMRIFKTRWFNRWATKEKVTDETLRSALTEMERGLIDADLGGHVYKKRVSIQGKGKSGGVRTLVAFKLGNVAFFLYGFAKNKQANINDKELRALKLLAAELLSYDRRALGRAVSAGELIEIQSNDDDE